MENEEKILTMLENLTGTVSTLVEKVDRLEQGQSELKQDVSVIKQDVSSLKQGQTRLEIIVENDVKPSIQAIAEQHGTIIKKLDGLPEKVIALQDTTTVHGAAIKEISRRTANI